jgi:V8-like Glu-specific endopeptidase
VFNDVAETLDPWDYLTIANLGEALADLYWSVDDSMRLVRKAGLSPKYVRFDHLAANNWSNILQYAKNQGKVDALVNVALSENPDHELLKLARQRRRISLIKGPDIRTDVAWNGPAEPERLEKIIGKQSTLVPVSFLDIGIQRSHSVARVRLASEGSGTGFLISNNLLITNHHVLPDIGTAKKAVAEFNFQKTTAGLDAPIDSFPLAPDDFFVSSPEDDWTAVRVQDNPSARWGQLELEEQDISEGDRVNIIQHPGGGPKQLSFFHNVVVFVGGDRVQYLTDTLPGSSGSPVFDKEWRVVALHHSGGYLTEPASKSKMTYYRNEGIHVRAIVRRLREEGGIRINNKEGAGPR